MKYPRIVYRDKGFGKGKCELCENVLAGRVHVQINHMRGDDNVHQVCPRCQKIYTNFGLLVKLGYEEPT